MTEGVKFSPTAHSLPSLWWKHDPLSRQFMNCFPVTLAEGLLSQLCFHTYLRGSEGTCWWGFAGDWLCRAKWFSLCWFAALSGRKLRCGGCGGVWSVGSRVVHKLLWSCKAKPQIMQNCFSAMEGNTCRCNSSQTCRCVLLVLLLQHLAVLFTGFKEGAAVPSWTIWCLS